MGLNTEERQNIVYFTGYEVEHTICHGMKTLFVVGTPLAEEILAKAKEHEVKMIYFGTSQSFNPQIMSHEEYKPWDSVIFPCLKADYWVTLDFDVRHAEGILESGYNEYEKFVSMVSVKMPYINQFNYNTTVKLDDRTWGATNPGVWSVPLGALTQRKYYTHWDQYTQDTSI
jgi:hypothetical protein